MSNLSPDYQLETVAPSVAEYCRLRSESGLTPMKETSAAVALPNSWYAVCVRHHDEAVGMGRIIGDGGCFFQIVDIAVLPEHQRRGIGQAMMAALVTALRERVPPGALVSLLADGEAHRLYEQYGFKPSAPASIGMILRL